MTYLCCTPKECIGSPLLTRYLCTTWIGLSDTAEVQSCSPLTLDCMLTSIQATMSSLESWYFGAHYLSLLPRCLRLAPNVTIRHSKLAFGGAAYSFPSRIHTYTLSYPCRAHCLTPLCLLFPYTFFRFLGKHLFHSDLFSHSSMSQLWLLLSGS